MISNGGFMTSHALVWAGVPHNSDGVVFQIRIFHGLQRFYISRRVLEDVFDLEPSASDAKQLALFYTFLNHVLEHASKKRAIASASTVSLHAADFDPPDKRESRRSEHVLAQSAA